MPDSPLSIWNDIAPWWSARIGEGNAFQRELIMPATDRLLALRPGEAVLDCCCGNGNYARRMARQFGARVTAFDGAPNFIEAARAHPDSAGINWHVADATNPDDLARLTPPAGRWPAIVCSMALMDLPDLQPLLRAMAGWLAPAADGGGRFVFSVPHPCFSSNQPAMTAELSGDDQTLAQSFGVRVERYITPWKYLSTGIVNQPQRHWLWHRPLAVLLAECFAAGLVLDGLEEPVFPAEKAGSAKNAFSFAKRPELPPALVVRVRRG